MDHEFDLFEVSLDGSPLWREAVAGQENAMLRLKELSSKTTNEVRMIDLRTNVVLAVMNRSLAAN